MRKSVKILLIVAALVALAAVLLPMWLGPSLVRRLVTQAVEQQTGFGCHVEGLTTSLIGRDLELQGLTLTNPEAFGRGEAAVIRRLYVRYALGSLFGQKAHLYQMDLDVQRLVVVRLADGSCNFEVLAQAAQPARPAPQDRRDGAKPAAGLPPAEPAPAAPGAPEPSTPRDASVRTASTSSGVENGPASRTMHVDRLHLQIGEIEYRDFSRGAEPMVMHLPVAIDRTYEQVEDFEQIGQDVAVQVALGMAPYLLQNLGELLNAPPGEQKARTREMQKAVESLLRGL